MTLKIDLDPAKREDYGPRFNVPVDTLVLHTTEGASIIGATKWHDRDDVIASAHYFIDGKRIVLRVPEGMCAWHAGNKSVNRRSIGIEVVGYCDDAALWTPAVMAQLVALSLEIIKRHSIPLVHQPGPGICGHADVPDPTNPNLRGGFAHHRDPGVFFNWTAYFDALRSGLREKMTA